MKSSTVGRPHNSSVVNLPLSLDPPPSPIGPLSSRGTHKALAAHAAAEKARRHCCVGCCGSALFLLFVAALTIGLLFPRVPSVSLSPTAPSVGATVAVAADGTFTFNLRAAVVVDASSSYAPWQVKGVGITLLGTSSSSPAFSLQYKGTLTAAARARTTFTVRATMTSAGVGNLVPSLALISSVASGAPTFVTVVVAFTPVYLGYACAYRGALSNHPPPPLSHPTPPRRPTVPPRSAEVRLPLEGVVV